MSTHPKQVEAHALPSGEALPRREWHVRAPFDEFLVIGKQDVLAGERNQSVPWKLMLASMPARSSLLTQRMYQGLYEVATGHPHQDLQLGCGEPKGLESRVKEAFYNDTLVALQTGNVLKGGFHISEPVQATATPQPVPVLESPPPPAALPSPLQNAPPLQESEPSTTFVAIKFVDEEGKPIPGIRYKLTLSDGSTREGCVNDQGEAREEDIRHPGECRVEFLDFDNESDPDSESLA
jgi:hypothetical protein